MGDYGKFKWVFRLLKSKEGRKVVLIPLIIMIVFSGYEIYQMEFNSKPEITEMQDGSGEIKLSKRSELAAFKLPKETGEIRDILGEDAKVRSYDVFCDKEHHIKSAMVSIKADETKAQEIMASYKDKYSLEEGAADLSGSAEGYEMWIHYDANDHRIDIDLKKSSD